MSGSEGGRFTTPSNGAKVSIQLWIQLGSGWVTYDDVSLRPVVTYNLTYDAENRLSGVSGAATATFVYDGDGVRVKATAGGVTTAYVGNYFEWTGSTSTMVKYYYAGTTRIAMRTGSGTFVTPPVGWVSEAKPAISSNLADPNLYPDTRQLRLPVNKHRLPGASRGPAGSIAFRPSP